MDMPETDICREDWVFVLPNGDRVCLGLVHNGDGTWERIVGGENKGWCSSRHQALGMLAWDLVEVFGGPLELVRDGEPTRAELVEQRDQARADLAAARDAMRSLLNATALEIDEDGRAYCVACGATARMDEPQATHRDGCAWSAARAVLLNAADGGHER
jgi:hypothetical protein